MERGDACRWDGRAGEGSRRVTGRVAQHFCCSVLRALYLSDHQCGARRVFRWVTRAVGDVALRPSVLVLVPQLQHKARFRLEEEVL